MKEYVNKQKLELAEQEARLNGGDVEEIYVRMGGLVKVVEIGKPSKETFKETIKKIAKKK